jgi:hypothetical protein
MSAAKRCTLGWACEYPPGGCPSCMSDAARQEAASTPITPRMIVEAGMRLPPGRGLSWGGVEAFGRVPTDAERAHLAAYDGPGLRTDLEEFLDPRGSPPAADLFACLEDAS